MRLAVSAALLATVVVPSPHPDAALHAQSGPTVERTVRGQVNTADGVGILGATLWLVGTHASNDSTLAATTDATGAFRFVLPVSETSVLVVRRRGFDDARLPLTIDAPPSKKPVAVAPITLAAVGSPAAAVVVPDTGVFTGSTAQFFRHLAARRGEFVTRAELVRDSPVRTSSVLRNMRGVQLVAGSSGGTYVRLRGHNCYPGIWIDGAQVGSRTFDIDMISPQALMGIELYAMPSGLPPEYQTMESMSCGAVAFWTRRGSGDDGAMDLSSFIDPAGVRSAKDVDVPARVADGFAFVPRYPAESRASGVGGRVIVELVVDTDGAVERSSPGLVAANTSDLAAATLAAAQRLRFVPATLGGKPVRQLVQLVADFRSSGRSARMPD